MGENLMQRLQQLDWRFSLRLRVPALIGDLFPVRFASTRRSEPRSRSVSESEVSRYSVEEDCDDDDVCSWDITWSWEDDWNSEEVDHSQECEEWDITWDWQLDWAGHACDPLD